jgi:surfactin synthase thioesterase subunit
MPSFSITATAASIALIFGMVCLREGEGGNGLELILFPHADIDKRRFRQLIANSAYRMLSRAAAIPSQQDRHRSPPPRRLRAILCAAKIQRLARAWITSLPVISVIRHR